jgi:hypothetical protein
LAASRAASRGVAGLSFQLATISFLGFIGDEFSFIFREPFNFFQQQVFLFLHLPSRSPQKEIADSKIKDSFYRALDIGVREAV